MAVDVRIQQLCKVFGTTRALDAVSLDIRPGELFFLLGPSGCGKTTLLRCLAGFCEPDSGTIRFGGQDVTQVPPHERDAGMVFQSYALWPHMTVEENVAFGLEMRRISKREIRVRVAEVLDTVRMADRSGHKPNQLSGGQQQRVALARALVIRPRCLLLDEPLSNLDAKLRMEMRAEIRHICKEAGLTAVYVTHDQKEALSVADRLAIMDGGTIRQIGTPREVYENPVDTFVAGFVGETNFLRGRIRSVSGGQVEVETSIGVILSSLHAPPGLKPGDAVVVSLRPEVMRLSPARSSETNRFSGSVHHSVYLGETAQHLVSMDPLSPNSDESDRTLKVFELHPRIVARDRPERAEVCVDPADVLVLAR